MRAVLLIEEDTLIRELMREHLEREGYVTCAVSSVRIALNAARWTRFGLVMLDFATADACNSAELEALRGLGGPVVMMRSAPAGSVTASEGEIEQVVWSPFDLTTLTCAVRRFLPGDPERLPVAEPEGPPIKQSGTYTRTETTRDIGEMSTLPAPPENDDRGVTGDKTLEALGQLVMESTDGRKVG